MPQSNGCGAYGTLSRVWQWAAGQTPPFEDCCHQHDCDYETHEVPRLEAEVFFHE